MMTKNISRAGHFFLHSVKYFEEKKSRSWTKHGCMIACINSKKNQDKLSQLSEHRIARKMFHLRFHVVNETEKPTFL